MRIILTARHCDVPPALRARARGALARAGRRAARALDGQIRFTAAHGAAGVELVLHGGRQRIYVARGDAADHRTALDRAIDRLRRQLDKGAPRRRRAAARDAT